MNGILLGIYQNMRSFITVPGAPTIGAATQTGATTATVIFTAPASNGGAVITSYTATSSPGGVTGTLSQAGSGTITVSGLTTDTTYTFTVKATNSIGQSAESAVSNSITPVAPSILTVITSPEVAGRCVASDSLNNVIVFSGAAITKFDSSGVRLWSYTNASITVESMVVDSSDNIYAAGSASGGLGFIAKFNSSGTVVWQNTQNPGLGQGSFYQRTLTWYTIRLDSSGNIYLGGTYYDNSRQSYCCCGNNVYYLYPFGYMATAKYNSSGTFQWARKFGSTSTSGIGLANLEAYGCAVDASGNVIISGTSTIHSSGTNAMPVLKYNSSGTQQWGYAYKNDSTTVGSKGFVDCDSSDNIYIASEGSPCFLKVNSSGTFQWGRGISGTAGSVNKLKNLYLDRTNSLLYVPGGYYINAGSQYYEGLLIKSNTEGELQFGRTLGYQSGVSRDEITNGVVISSDNQMVFSGKGYASSSGASGGTWNVLGRTPVDGSKTGTYSLSASIIYASVSLTISSQSFTTSLATVVYGSVVADSAFSYTDAASAYSYTTQATSYTTAVL